jgi:hypothetical protein
MVWLVAICLVAFVFYWWLKGHWFGRVGMFLALIPLFAFIVAGILVSATGRLMDDTAIIDVPLGAIAAWFASGIPIMIRERRALAGTRRIGRIDIYPRVSD